MMVIINGFQKISPEIGTVVATIGNFDGVHLGHQRIIQEVIKKGEDINRKKALITFDPHPARVIFPARAPQLIYNRRQKISIIEDLGMDILLFIPFDRDLSLQTAEEFLRNLMKRMTFSFLFIGENFRFGRNRSADCKTLAALGEKLGFHVECVPFVKVDDLIVSSSAIREALRNGEVAQAARLLGRPYSIQGRVVPGEGRGAMMNIPTANIHPYNEIIPGRGIYITEIEVRGKKFQSVTNIGIRPTFNLVTQTIESHILDFRNHIYGEKVELFFYQRVRDEFKFQNAQLLKERILKDIKEMKAFFQRK